MNHFTRSKWSQLFDPTLENLFVESKESKWVSTGQSLIRSWFFIAAIVGLIAYLAGNDKFSYIAPIGGLFGLCCLVIYPFTYTKYYKKNSEMIFLSVSSILQFTLIFTLTKYSSDALVSAFMPLIFIMIGADFFMLPARHKWRISVNAIKTIAYIFLILNRGIYPSLEGGPGLLVIYLAGVVIWGFSQSRRNEIFDRREFILDLELSIEKGMSDKILHQVLPTVIAEKLKIHGTKNIAQYHPKATVLFADLNGFTAWSTEQNANHIVFMLDLIFDRFDSIAAEFDVQKIKTIGDSYMAAAGLLDPDPNAAIKTARFAEKVLREFEVLKNQFDLPLALRLGIHIGPVVSGVIGKKRYSFDIWGPTVNYASRLESIAEPGSICVSAEFHEETKQDNDYSEAKTKQIKGIGERQVYKLIADNVSTKKIA